MTQKTLHSLPKTEDSYGESMLVNEHGTALTIRSYGEPQIFLFRGDAEERGLAMLAAARKVTDKRSRTGRIIQVCVFALTIIAVIASAIALVAWPVEGGRTWSSTVETIVMTAIAAFGIYLIGGLIAAGVDTVMCNPELLPTVRPESERRLGFEELWDRMQVPYGIPFREDLAEGLTIDEVTKVLEARRTGADPRVLEAALSRIAARHAPDEVSREDEARVALQAQADAILNG